MATHVVWISQFFLCVVAAGIFGTVAVIGFARKPPPCPNPYQAAREAKDERVMAWMCLLLCVVAAAVALRIVTIGPDRLVRMGATAQGNPS